MVVFAPTNCCLSFSLTANKVQGVSQSLMVNMWSYGRCSVSVFMDFHFQTWLLLNFILMYCLDWSFFFFFFKSSVLWDCQSFCWCSQNIKILHNELYIYLIICLFMFLTTLVRGDVHQVREDSCWLFSAAFLLCLSRRSATNHVHTHVQHTAEQITKQ